MSRVDAGRFAAVYATLYASHDLADHVVQTDAAAAGKSSSWRAMTSHVGSYGATQLAALAALRAAGVELRPGRVLAGLAVSLASHAFLDRRWPVVALLERTGSARFAHPEVRVSEPPSTEARRRYDRDVRLAHELATLGISSETLREVVDAPRPEGPEEGTLVGPLPLHGPYLADQSLHHVCLVIAAGVIAWGPR